MAHLFEPLALRGLSLPNRIMVSPMCQYSASNGNATAWHQAHLGSLALGGAGMLCLEATAVSQEGRITPGCLGLWSDENETALAGVLRMLRASSSIKLAIQLGHAGRKASSAAPWNGGQLIAIEDGGWQPLAPSALPQKPQEPAPHALAAGELDRIKADFVRAATRAVRLGFDAIELHAAHGYLLHQFLSPIANRRDDHYGGSLENRMRYPLEVFDAVRAAVPDAIPVGVRVSATDWIDDEPSWTPDQTVEFGMCLKAKGVDWLDVSSGGVSHRQRIPVGPGYQVHLAQAVKREVGVPTVAVGLITEPRQAQAIVADGQADLVALGRAVLYNPRWAWHAAAELDGKVEGPPQYWRSLPAGKSAVFGNTTFGMR
ncbi:NADH:flavin oxidoreductase/NADH oxidase [Pollutimonas sp. M17]|uniref:NADH:flavin oxidoreductase/NADH oxidase n=1 Tax=Pollutimonas sp. M17 TaxID=2962065 RepID=UPI0021F4ED9C|nr:NADH:flavin oxidoreductase/NADH oxidase [Pollutimonas sp. M17]UYO93437.1 NADH:flavin oxidoreductase/NADH oxidase [Pollutimonas sp. M17]